MTLGELIRSYREQNRLSQRQFAEKSGVSNGYISMLEKNANPRTGQPLTPSMPLLKRVAAAMGMTVSDLCAYVDDLAAGLGATVMDYEEAQEKLRMILTEREYALIKAYRGADVRAQDDALILLERHAKG